MGQAYGYELQECRLVFKQGYIREKAKSWTSVAVMDTLSI